MTNKKISKTVVEQNNDSELLDIEQELTENLRKWFKEKWVRFNPQGKIMGACARGSEKEGKPKCLPQKKAQALGKKGRASAAARKRRKDPNPERSGKAINVNTKKKSNESVSEGITPNTIHKLADHKGIKWDNDPSFLRLTKRLTGKEHLDDLNQEELTKVKDYLSKQGAAEGKLTESATFLNPQTEGSLREFVPDNGNDGNDDSLFIYAKMWYNGDLKTQQQVEKILQKNGLDIGENEDENGGAYISDSTGDYYESWTAKDLKEGVVEGRLTESAIFLNPNTVIVGQEHGKSLDLSPETLKKVQAIAAKHGAWYEGDGADRAYTRGIIDKYEGSWDDKVAQTASVNDPKWLYVLFANVDANNRVQRVGINPKSTIFNQLLSTAKDNSYQGIGFTKQALQKFLSLASEGEYDFVKMSQQPATQENLTHFLKSGEDLMWPSNWEQYPNRAGKIAKAATVDIRDQYLATRKSGVYVTGDGHLKAVQKITGQQGVAESQSEQMSKTKALNALRKELMNTYEYMKSGNLLEFQQRLQWLSEGMLKNHLTNSKGPANQKEKDLYIEYREKREQIQRGFPKQGAAEEKKKDVAEGMDSTQCVEKGSTTKHQKIVTEYRDRMFQYIKSVLPKWPDYVIRDWIYNLARGEHRAGPGYDPEDPDWKFNSKTILTMINREDMSPDTQWKLVPDFQFRFDKLHPDTQRRLRERAGGTLNPYNVPKDAERHAIQAQLAQQQGGVRKEPVIGKITPQGFELIEGWHRTIQHFKQYPDGYTGPAYVAMIQQGVAEGTAHPQDNMQVLEYYRVKTPYGQEYAGQLMTRHPQGGIELRLPDGHKKWISRDYIQSVEWLDWKDPVLRSKKDVREGKYDYSLDDYLKVPYDSGDESSKLISGTDHNPNIGPQEGKYLNLMLKKMKPITVISKQQPKSILKQFEPYIENKTLSVAYESPRGVYISLPGEEWRGKKLDMLWNKFGDIVKTRGFPMDDPEIKMINAKIGILLGIPKESVKWYLDNKLSTPKQDITESKRIPRKPGQPANSKKHSDLYTDENPKGTIKGLKFSTVEDAKASVNKIRNSGRSHAHKIQAAVAMEQRAIAANKTSAAAIYRSFINSMKKKTNEEQLDELKCWPGYTRVKGVPAGKPGSCKKKTNEEQLDEKWSKKYKDSINCSNPKGFSQKAHCAGKKKRKTMESKKCPHCGGLLVSEELINEKKDACYYKVRSRYKVWPSAYASGALVQCRKKGAKNWGKGKTNESVSLKESLAAEFNNFQKSKVNENVNMDTVNKAKNITSEFRNADMHKDIILRIMELASFSNFSKDEMADLDDLIEDVLKKQSELAEAINNLTKPFEYKANENK